MSILTMELSLRTLEQTRDPARAMIRRLCHPQLERITQAIMRILRLETFAEEQLSVVGYIPEAFVFPAVRAFFRILSLPQRGASYLRLFSVPDLLHTLPCQVSPIADILVPEAAGDGCSIPCDENRLPRTVAEPV